jgi:hypothetical protein
VLVFVLWLVPAVEKLIGGWIKAGRAAPAH